MFVWCLRRPELCIRYIGTSVTSGYESLCVCWKRNLPRSSVRSASGINCWAISRPWRMFDFLTRTKWYCRNKQYHRSSLLGFPIVYSIWRTQKRSKQNLRWPINTWHFYEEAVWRNEALYRKVITCFILVPWASLLLASQVQVNYAAQTSQVYQMFLQVLWVIWSSSCGPCRFLFLLDLKMLFHCLKTSGGSCEMNELHLARGKQANRRPIKPFFFLLFKSKK